MCDFAAIGRAVVPIVPIVHVPIVHVAQRSDIW